MTRRAVARHLFTLLAAASLLACAAVCVLWVRGRTATDDASWTYDRYLPDRSAASTEVRLVSDKRRLSLSVSWGQVGPYNGQLVYGYYVRADQSGGRPRLSLDRYGYDHQAAFDHVDIDPFIGASGRGPLRWQSFTRTTVGPPGERFRLIRVGVAHWLAALLLLVLPVLWLRGLRKARRARRLGLCPACGYDLRGTPDRCPECGTPAPAGARAAT